MLEGRLAHAAFPLTTPSWAIEVDELGSCRDAWQKLFSWSCFCWPPIYDSSDESNILYKIQAHLEISNQQE